MNNPGFRRAGNRCLQLSQQHLQQGNTRGVHCDSSLPSLPTNSSSITSREHIPSPWAAPLSGVRGNHRSEHLRPQTSSAGGSSASGRTRGDKQPSGFHDNQFRCHRWRDAGGDAPGEGTRGRGCCAARGLHLAGNDSSGAGNLLWKCLWRSWERPQPGCCAWLSSAPELMWLQSPGQGVTAAMELGGAGGAQGVCCSCPSLWGHPVPSWDLLGLSCPSLSIPSVISSLSFFIGS